MDPGDLETKLRMMFWVPNLAFIEAAPKQSYFDWYGLSNHIQSCYRILIQLFVMCAKRWSLSDDQQICTNRGIV